MIIKNADLVAMSIFYFEKKICDLNFKISIFCNVQLFDAKMLN